MISSNGYIIKDRPNSHIHESVTNLLQEAIDKIALGAAFIAAEVDMGRVIGYSDCVTTTDSDIIEFIVRPGRKGPSRIVFNREAIPTNKVTVVLKKVYDDEYIIITAFIGPKAGLEPWDPRATEEDCEFWKTHALRYECIWD